jgi:hypothetical protein
MAHVVHRQFLGNRQRIRKFTPQVALDVLRATLRGPAEVALTLLALPDFCSAS